VSARKKVPAEPPFPELDELLDSWELHLRAERKSAQTVKSYINGVEAFLRWCERAEAPPLLTKQALQMFVVDLLDVQGNKPATVQSRHLACRRFTAWMLAEKIITEDPLEGVTGVKVDAPEVDPLTPDQIKALIKACEGARFIDRRDEAIIRFMCEVPTRATEVAEMTVKGLDLRGGTATMPIGKNGRSRVVGFSPFTAKAIDRYLRLRRRHALAATDRLWLGDHNMTFGYYGLWWSVRERAKQAGLEDMHPHRLRHTAADGWLAKGGSEGGLMATAGWQTYSMVQRYTRRRAQIRAVDEAHRLGLGDF
jgi:site-specific recombinase XerD